ncbi:hypothetical protein [Paenibacillus nasutitermitis]|uniref:Uncharacterized protein n=1 Tax=Paenibacillus nasutitermitis TaxID=1652958 RepID=A0A916ZDT5_9BACL|nr:hypothetical protein [Paenibacillus nasutitermitis]GGD91237.1 hypothetical protein GCM10010911_57400 [Paenibacillus nasutitermitis]
MKRKSYTLIVASVGISAFLAIGSVYAQSNAGLILQDWYKARSHQLNDRMVHSTVVQGLEKATQRVKHSSSGLAEHADENLAKTLDAGSKEVITGIQSASEAYRVQMEQKMNELSEAIKNQKLDPYISTATSKSSDELEKFAEDTIEQLTQQLDGGEGRADSN